MNKDTYLKLSSSIKIDDFPSLPCPYCGKGELSLSKKSIRFMPLESKYDSLTFEQEDFERGVLLGLLKLVVKVNEESKWYQSRFTAFLQCASCKEPVSILGRARQPLGLEIHKTLKLRTELNLEYISPPIPIFELKKEYPVKVTEELGRSFALFFSDSSSAASRLRVATELFLDSEGVQKYRIGKLGEYKLSNNNKKMKLSLHERIQYFACKNKDYSKMLLGIKSLGNESSHKSSVNRKDLLNAYEVFEHILKSLFITVKVHKNHLALSEDLENKYK